MRKLSILALLFASVATPAFTQNEGQTQVPASVENYAPPPVEQPISSSQIIPDYMYTPYKIDSVYRASPFVVVAVANANEVKKDERGLLWTFTSFQVRETLKGIVENNLITTRVVGGYQESPLLKESLYTGGLDLRFDAGKAYVLFIDGTSEDGFPILTRQHVFDVEGAAGSEVIKDFKGGTLKIKKADGSIYSAGEPVLLSDFLAALKKVK